MATADVELTVSSGLLGKTSLLDRYVTPGCEVSGLLGKIEVLVTACAVPVKDLLGRLMIPPLPSEGTTTDPRDAVSVSAGDEDSEGTGWTVTVKIRVCDPLPSDELGRVGAGDDTLSDVELTKPEEPKPVSEVELTRLEAGDDPPSDIEL